MPANFTFSGSGASFNIRDQTISGDTGCRTVTNSHNQTTTKTVNSNNTNTTTDNGTYNTTQYCRSRELPRSYDYSDTTATPHTQHPGEVREEVNMNYTAYPYYAHPNEFHDHVNSNYGLPLGPGSPHSIPSNEPVFKTQPLPPWTPQTYISRSQQGELYQSFVLPNENYPNQPHSVASMLLVNDPVERYPVAPETATVDSRPASPFNRRSPNPFRARLASNTTSPAVDAQNFTFATPRTEPGMISPLQLPAA